MASVDRFSIRPLAKGREFHTAVDRSEMACSLSNSSTSSRCEELKHNDFYKEGQGVMRDYGISMVAPSSSQDAPPSMEVIDHNIQTLKRLMGQLEIIRKDTESFTTEHSDHLRLPKEVMYFHTRKELVQTERQIRVAIGEIFGEQSTEFRKHQHLRVGLGTQSGIPQAIRSLEDLAFRLEEKRLHLLGGHGHLEDNMPDVDPLTDLYTRRLLYRYFGHELDRSKRHGFTVSLMYFTLKNWQEVAALHGSSVWEEMIVLMACACKAALRGYDYGSRISEHEFALLLPQTETQGAHVVIRRVAEQFHCAAKKLTPGLKVTLEFGTATFPFDGDTLTSLFDTATGHRMSFTDDLKSIRLLSH